MDTKEKELLLKELCARLPYGVKVSSCGYIATLSPVMIATIMLKNDVNNKPYLRPMSSMTEEEREEYEMLQVYPGFKTNHTDLTDMYDFLNKNHFDYRGLIEKGLALEAPEGMYKIK